MSDLITLKTHRNEKFSTIYLGAVEDSRLSWKAKGLHTYLISRPPGWVIRLTDLLRRAGDGKTSLLAGVEELKESGYILITRTKDEKGRFTGTLWEVYEVSQTVKESASPYEESASPYSDFPDAEKPDSGFSIHGKSDPLVCISSSNHHKTTTTETVVVVSEEDKGNDSPKSHHTQPLELETEAVKEIHAGNGGTKLEGMITEGAIREAIKVYNPKAHAEYQPETPTEGIKRILRWMTAMISEDTTAFKKSASGFLIHMAQKGMDKPGVMIRAEQAAEAERREAEERRRKREKEAAIKNETLTREEREQLLGTLMKKLTRSGSDSDTGDEKKIEERRHLLKKQAEMLGVSIKSNVIPLKNGRAAV
ncbi:MAG: hypothetical protein ACOYU2_06145 [Nitrospirota bacterium]